RARDRDGWDGRRDQSQSAKTGRGFHANLPRPGLKSHAGQSGLRAGRSAGLRGCAARVVRDPHGEVVDPDGAIVIEVITRVVRVRAKVGKPNRQVVDPDTSGSIEIEGRH